MFQETQKIYTEKAVIENATHFEAGSREMVCVSYIRNVFQEQSYMVWGEAFWGLCVGDQTPPHPHLNQCFPL